MIHQHYALYDQLFQSWKNPPSLTPPNQPPPTETEQLIQYINYQPWRAPKIKNLKKHYKPWSSSWEERFRTSTDDPDHSTIYLYTIKDNRDLNECTRGIDMYAWPFLWTRQKIDRLAWIQKCFFEDVEALTIQEHMELDAFNSEYDMPLRWCMFRLYEVSELNSLALYLYLCFDFMGVFPTDLGLRPDGTMKTCPIQFHNCISSSNSPFDESHYAPPFRWARTKSPDQAIEEVKNVYDNYPKRGLRWASGWIDRGGWYPQQFSGDYFYSQARSLIWHYTDDIELLVNRETREVQYRSAGRLGQTDNDVQRLRYNQFARMLNAKEGWDAHELTPLHYEWNIPAIWSQHFLDDNMKAIDFLTHQILTNLQLRIPTEMIESPLVSSAVENLKQYEQVASSYWQGMEKEILTRIPGIDNLLENNQDIFIKVEEKFQKVEQFIDSLRETQPVPYFLLDDTNKEVTSTPAQPQPEQLQVMPSLQESTEQSAIIPDLISRPSDQAVISVTPIQEKAKVEMEQNTPAAAVSTTSESTPQLQRKAITQPSNQIRRINREAFQSQFLSSETEKETERETEREEKKTTNALKRKEVNFIEPLLKSSSSPSSSLSTSSGGYKAQLSAKNQKFIYS